MDELFSGDCCSGQRNQPPLTVEELVAFLEKNGKRAGKCFMKWAKKNGISKADALDAIQDVLYGVLMRIATRDASPRHLDLPVLITSARRQAVRNHRTSKAVLPTDQMADGVAYRRLNPEEVYQAMKAAVPAALEDLEEDDRELLVFCDVQENTQKEAAKWWGVDQGNISRRLGEARRRLQRSIIAILLRNGFDRSELPVIPL